MAPRNKKQQATKGSVETIETPEQLMEKYSNVLTDLTEKPYDRSLHSLHLELTNKLGDAQAKEEARGMLSGYYLLSETEWLEWINEREASLQQDDIQQQVNLLELYAKSIQDYLSIPLLIAYSKHVISSYYTSKGLSLPKAVSSDAAEADEDADEAEDVEMNGTRKIGEPNVLLETVFGIDNVREIRDEILAVADRHMTESHLVWSFWKQFEIDLLSLATAIEERAAQLETLDQLFLARLKSPHSQIEQTFSEYSTFITKYDNQHYDEKLPAANKIFSQTKKLVDERDDEERKLKSASLAEHAYLDYLSWELEPKKPDYTLLRSLFERAIASHPTSSDLWSLYLDAFSKAPKASSNILSICEKAVKAVPGNEKVWSIFFKVAEKNSLEVDEVFERAVKTALFDESVEGLVTLYEGRASYHRRQVDQIVPPGEELENADMIDLVVGILREGIVRVQEASKKGDSLLRLEKYLLRQLERFGRIEEAAQLWESLTDSKKSSYAVWYGRADFLTRHNDIITAHQVYVQGCSERSLDYPEYLIDAWQSFEIQNGNLADLEFSLTKIARQRKGLEKKREREMKQYQDAQAARFAQQEKVDHFISHAVHDGGKKRDRSPAAAPTTTQDDSPAPKKVRIDAPAPQASTSTAPAPTPATNDSAGPTRDRENSTVFVTAPSSIEMTEGDLKQLFRDCGEFRECKLKTLGSSTVAMIEFMSASDVLAARTKDKKRIREEEIQVEVAWQSCLYVTNFPEEWDKAKVEELFGEHGAIFDTRWPSKRFKSTRRFCYVQFTNAQSAISAASALHNKRLDSKHTLQALISDPNRKKGRTDIGANDRELYIAGLSKFTKELDLRRLFESHGTIKGIRVGENDKGECKGFAFVEYEDEASAQAALVLNNTEIKKRYISVTIAQARARGTQSAIDSTSSSKKPEPKAAVFERSIRVSGFEAGTEEAIVQQVFAKFAAVKLVTMEVGSTNAVVEFENAAEAGKVLLASASEDGIDVDGKKVNVVADGPQLRGSAASSVGAPSKPSSDAPLLPRQAGRSRGRVGLGARGSRGSARGGIGARPITSTTPTALTSSTPQPSKSNGSVASTSAGAKSQDDFRALLNKK